MFYDWLKMIPFKVGLGALFLLLIAAVAFLGIISYRYSKRTLETAALVNHSHQVLDQAEEVASFLKDMQLESTAFFVDGDSARREDYRRAREGAARAVATLSQFVVNDSHHDGRLDSVRLLLDKLLTSTDGAFRQGRVDAVSKETIRERLAVNTGYRTQLRRMINELKRVEKQLLVRRENDNRESIRAFKATFFELLAAISLLLVVTFFSIRYNFLRRTRIEADLRSVSDLFSKIFYESPIAILISEQESGVVLNCNKVLSRMVNRQVGQIIGHTDTQLGFFENPDQRRRALATETPRGTTRYMETYISPFGGDRLYVSLSIQPIQLYEKRCLLIAIMDLTAHKRAEETTQKALEAEIELNKMKTAFVTMASHEFRTPLTAILSSASLLEKYSGGSDHDRALKHIVRIRSSVSSLTSILDEFLSVTRIEEGKVQPNFEEINFRAFIHDLCSDLKPMGKPGQCIVCRHEGVDKIATDPVLMSNIVSGLVSNAIKYSPEGGVIEVTTTTDGGVLRVTVADSGIGIPLPDQKHLFQRFYRASNAGNVQGTGLGLHLSKKYAEMLGGDIRVESEEGRGTSVTVEFDLQRDSVPHRKRANVAGKGKRDGSNLQSYKEIL